MTTNCCKAPRQGPGWQAAKAAPWTFYIGMSVLFLITWNGSILLLLLLAGLVSLINDVGLKNAFKNADFAERPDPPCDGCSTYSNCSGDVSITPGMPSGHSCLMTFLTCFVALYAYNAYKDTATRDTDAKGGTTKNKDKKNVMGRYILSVVLMAVIAGCVMWTRNAEGCHSGTQIGAGAAVGFTCFLLIWVGFKTYIYKHEHKKIRLVIGGEEDEDGVWHTRLNKAYSPFFGHLHAAGKSKAQGHSGGQDDPIRLLLST